MKPILFNTENVRALLDGRKTATRMLVMPQPRWHMVHITDGSLHGYWMDGSCQPYRPSYYPGDILYVREPWAMIPGTYPGDLHFKASATKADLEWFRANGWKWRRSTHMPKKAARIFLRVTDVLAERLNDITVEGALCEGISDVEPPPICKKEPSYPESFPKGFDKWSAEKREDWIQSAARARYIGWYEYADKLLEKFGAIWNNTIKKADLPIYGWEANPYVWVIRFERISKEEVSQRVSM